MEELIKDIVEKISSYNIFNNLFPGIVFCFVVERTTRFSVICDDICEKLFVYYFIGMIINRIGSVFIEKCLKAIKVKNRTTNCKEPFLKFAPYNMYIEASQKDPFITTLNEMNNVYRTIIATVVLIMITKLFDWLIYDWVNRLGQIGNNLFIVIVCLLIIILFIHSYRKQTDYIRKRIEECSDKNK